MNNKLVNTHQSGAGMGQQQGIEKSFKSKKHKTKERRGRKQGQNHRELSIYESILHTTVAIAIAIDQELEIKKKSTATATTTIILC